jgi:hypothetical protein
VIREKVEERIERATQIGYKNEIYIYIMDQTHNHGHLP